MKLKKTGKFAEISQLTLDIIDQKKLLASPFPHHIFGRWETPPFHIGGGEDSVHPHLAKSVGNPVYILKNNNNSVSLVHFSLYKYKILFKRGFKR